MTKLTPKDQGPTIPSDFLDHVRAETRPASMTDLIQAQLGGSHHGYGFGGPVPHLSHELGARGRTAAALLEGHTARLAEPKPSHAADAATKGTGEIVR